MEPTLQLPLQPAPLPITAARILLVDDDETVRTSLARVLARSGFYITGVGTVAEALRLISSQTFDVLLSDLHMPGAGDGLTVVSAMRHANPAAITLLLTGFPHMDAAAHAILAQTDEILRKPMSPPDLIHVIQRRLSAGSPPAAKMEAVASILERTADVIIQRWLARVHLEPSVMAVPLADAVRLGHLPQLFRDLVLRLRASHPLGSKELLSVAAGEHGKTRRRQGYSAAMMVEESRMLQVSIFETLEANLASIDFSMLLHEVMTIADEVDSQLAQAMACYMMESADDALLA
jgi:CheY-like chemotaxis protein